ncbi:uncharacterized protein LOC135157318 [Lytechinus pictus]|uniref:uncharacterized protein LOC135157318 n=1 Tax=Lytechinus pictus TaxID=7653 RepID=UPI0030B9D62E
MTNLTSPPTTPTNNQSTSPSVIINMTSLDPIGSTAGVGPVSESNQDDLKTRLVGEDGSQGEGRVEGYSQGVWGAWDFWSWDTDDAHDDQIPRIRFTSIPLGAWDPEDKMVEIYIDGDWKPLCHTHTSMYTSSLDVICRTVGLMLYRVLQSIPNNNVKKEGVALDCPPAAMNLSQCDSSLEVCEHVTGASCISGEVTLT